MSQYKVLQATNIEGVDRAVDEVVEVADQSLAEVLVRDGVVAEVTEGQAENPNVTAPADAGTGEGEVASA